LAVGEGWLDSYKGETLEGEVLLLIGRDYRALGDYPESFYWWLRAKEFYRSDVERRKTLHDRLVGIINTSQLEDLERLTAYAFGSEYEPRIYYALANLYLERNDLEAATEAAMRLVRSTPEQYWVSLGRELLERIDEEMSVKPHVVGCLLPLSGSFAIYGEEVLNGIELGIGIFDESEENLNLELVIKDTAGQPEETEVALQELVTDEKAIAVIGPLASKSALMAAERAQESGIPLIALTQREGITEEGDMVFRNFATPSQEVSRVLGAAMNDFGIERFAILYPDNSYGRFLMNLFWDQLEELGGSVTAVESYSPDATDFADQIKKMIGLFYERPLSVQQALEEMRSPEELESELEPTEPEPIIDFDAVFIPDNFQRIAMIAPQLAFHDVVDVLLMGTSLWQSPKLIELAKDYVQGAIFPSRFFDGNPDPVVQNFIGEYRNSFDTEPGILAASGYDTIRLVKDVVAGQAIQTRRDFRDALLSFYGIEGVTGWLSFEMNGEPASEPFLMTISGGQMVLLP
jgi:ABC-type branched-subunit amino acid transport system substrate-binding protein